MMGDIEDLRQDAIVIVAVPTRDMPDMEVYGSTRQEAIEVLRDWAVEDLRYAADARRLPVPLDADWLRLAEELVAAGPAWFGEHIEADAEMDCFD